MDARISTIIKDTTHIVRCSAFSPMIKLCVQLLALGVLVYNRLVYGSLGKHSTEEFLSLVVKIEYSTEYCSFDKGKGVSTVSFRS